jgi:hypothetical protein
MHFDKHEPDSAPPLYLIRCPPIPAIGKLGWDWSGPYSTLPEAQRSLSYCQHPSSFIAICKPFTGA